jgi:hypothetical protein
MTTMANIEADLAISFLLFELAYLSIGNLKTFKTMKVAKPIKIVLIVNR